MKMHFGYLNNNVYNIRLCLMGIIYNLRCDQLGTCVMVDYIGDRLCQELQNK